MPSVRPTSGLGYSGEHGWLAGTVWTLTAGATVGGGQPLFPSAANQVSPTAGTSRKVVGVALDDAASGGPVAVLLRGPVITSTASGSVAAGDTLISAASGRVAALADGDTVVGNARAQLGVALTAASDGQPVAWVMGQ